MLPGQKRPGARKRSNKNHRPKVLFLTAVARPRTLPDGTTFDGKIGMWRIAIDRKPVAQFRGTPDCNESAALHSYGPDAHCR